MTGRTHDLAAITALTAVLIAQPVKSLSLATLLVAIFANLLGGIAPDIDQPTAPLWRNLPVGHAIGKVFSLLNGGHRFITHSLLGLGLFALGAKLFTSWLQPITPHVDQGFVWWAFVIGMFSHLVMDSLTKEGVPWLLPLPLKFGFPPLKRLRLTTDKAGEHLLVFPGLLICLFILLSTHYQHLLAMLQQLHH